MSISEDNGFREAASRLESLEHRVDVIEEKVKSIEKSLEELFLFLLSLPA